MSIVVKQSFFNLITIGVAFIIGAVNTLYLYPTFLGSKLQGLVIALLAISNIIQPFLSFGTQHAVIRFYSRYRSNKEKNAVLTLSLIIPIIVTAVVIPLFYLYYDQIKVLLFQTENAFSQYAYVIMFIAVSTSFFEIFFISFFSTSISNSSLFEIVWYVFSSISIGKRNAPSTEFL